MRKRLKYYILFSIIIFIICGGILQVSNTLPKFIKNKSNVSVTYSFKPFDIKVETKKYLFTLDDKEIEEYESRTENEAQYLKNMVVTCYKDTKDNIVRLYNNIKQH